MPRSWLLVIPAILACVPVGLRAESPAPDSAIETVLTSLTQPCGVTVRPGESADRYEILIADSGTGRVLRIWNNEPQTTVEVISGFATATPESDQFPAGPTGLLLLDRTHVVVGVSNSEAATIRLFELIDEPTPMAADQAKQQLRLAATGRDWSHVHAFARTRANDAVSDDLLLTCSGNGAGEVRRIPLVAGTLTEVERFAGPRDEFQKDAPIAIAVGESGYVVVGWAGSLEGPQDSRLVFYNPKNGARLMELPMKLYDIAALAYNPKSGNLYAADLAWSKPEQGGVFRIDDASEPGNARCIAVKIADLQHPSALAFGPDGALYVTAWGDTNSKQPQGVLLRITGDL
jgi:hypothetical protein